MSNHKLFFPHEPGDDLFELYEERLFEDKQFFASKPILVSVFKKRYERMLQREKAFRGLTQTTSVYKNEGTLGFLSSQNIPDIYREFQKEKAIILRDIYSAENINVLLVKAEALTIMYDDYSKLWKLEHDFPSGGILISKEPNPGLLAQSINSFEQAGGKNIEDLQQLTYEGKETLLHEAKRLSLWRKKEIFDGRL